MTQVRDSYHVSLKTHPHQVDSMDLWWPTALNNGKTAPSKTVFQPFDPAGAQKISAPIKLVRTEEGGDGWRAFMDINKILTIKRNCSEMLVEV